MPLRCVLLGRRSLRAQVGAPEMPPQQAPSSRKAARMGAPRQLTVSTDRSGRFTKPSAACHYTGATELIRARRRSYARPPPAEGGAARSREGQGRGPKGEATSPAAAATAAASAPSPLAFGPAGSPSAPFASHSLSPRRPRCLASCPGRCWRGGRPGGTMLRAWGWRQSWWNCTQR